MSQSEFGKKLGVSRDVIGNIEYGRVIPKKIFTEHLCSIFDVNKDWLYTGKGNMFNDLVDESKELNEALDLFSQLNPSLQKYALKQIKGLFDIQREQKK